MTGSDPAAGAATSTGPDPAAGAATSHDPGRKVPAPDRTTWDLAVIGAGIAGLTLAHDVTRSGRSVVLLEASGRVGGLVSPLSLSLVGGSGSADGGADGGVRTGPVLLDGGAEAMGTRRPAAIELAEELGLAIERPAAGSWVQPAAGPARPVPPRSLLGVPSDLAHPLVAQILGERAARRAAEADSAGRAGALPGSASLADVVRYAMGEDVLERLVRPIAGALHASDPEELAIDVVAPGLRAALAESGSLSTAVASLVGEGPAVATVRGGMHLLPATLARAAVAAGAEIRTGAAVERLVRDGGAWQLQVAPGGTLRAREVVLAVPGPEALRMVEPEFPTAREVRLVPGAPVEHRTLILDAPALDRAPRGSGVIVGEGAEPGGRAVRAKALTHSSAKWPWVAAALGGRHAVRLSYGRPGEEPRLPGVDEALADAAALLGVDLTAAQLLATAPISHGGALAPQTPGMRETVTDLAATAAERDLHLAGAWVAGTGLPAVVAHARRLARRLV
ncbi:protoporphyrinogen/coproporphyrinogen oxidase [Georgenia sp. Z1491]|uniref:protoporphyrinogen/coproporphyrinogen oxidase n=1 Tax=Georgenia sp. Z1491 TaxID=3416707 RepID=UPI003CF1C009